MIVYYIWGCKDAYRNNVTSNKKNVDLKTTENNKNIGLEEDFYIIGPGDTLELKLFEYKNSWL